MLSATNAEYDAKKIETALKRLFKSITVTDGGRAAMRTRPGGKGKKFGGFKGAQKGGGKKFGSYMAETWDEYEAESATEEAYYQEYDEESEELDDMYENLAGVAEDEEMASDEGYTDAMVAY